MDQSLIAFILYAFLGLGIYELFGKIGKYQRENQSSLVELKDGLDSLDRKLDNLDRKLDSLDRKIEGCLSQIRCSIENSENILNNLEEKVSEIRFDVSLFENKM